MKSKRPVKSKKGKSVLQTILVPRDRFTLTSAKKWLLSHKYKNSKVDITENYQRWRQVDPTEGATYYTKTLPNGIILVFETL